MLMWLSGPTGSGKTSLAAILARTGYAVVREDLPAELFVAFAHDPAKHCASLQKAIMRSRAEQWSRIGHSDKIAFDRSVDEDIAIFCRMHHEAGLLTKPAMRGLRMLAERLQAGIPART